jgi:ATP-dependent helicase/nuclease subunit B
MAAAIEQVRAQLKQYGNCGEKPEFLLQLLETLDECKTFCVTPEVLRSAASRTQGALAVKLEELSLLAQSYDAVCANGAQDGSSRLAKLLQMLQEVPWAEGRHFYLEGFTDFNGLELAILTSLMESGAPVTAALLCDRPEGGLPVFDGARNTAKALCRAAERCGQTAQVVLCTPWEGSPALEYLRGHLFAAQTAACDAAAPELELYTAPDLFAEAEHLAGALLREAQNGQRWRSMTVVCGDMTRWRPVLQDVFARCSIPAYYSGSEPISEKPAIRAVLSGLAAAAGGMETEDVLAYLKSGFSGLSREGCDRLENYAFMWSVRGGGWKREWKMHPDGFGKKADARSTQRLQQLNADREAATAPLWRLRNALSAAKDTGEQVEALCDFLEEIGFAGRLQQLTEQFTAQGKLQQAQEAAQLYEILIGALEQLYAVLGKTVRSADAFVRLIQVLLSQYTVGTIPAAMDCVRVGALLDMRRSRTTRLFVVGAADGCFPACVQQTGLLSEHERERLRALGVPVAPGAPEKLEREMLAIYDVLSAPEAGLSVSCTAGQESYLFRRLQKLFPDAVCGGSGAAAAGRAERCGGGGLCRAALAHGCSGRRDADALSSGRGCSAARGARTGGFCARRTAAGDGDGAVWGQNIPLGVTDRSTGTVPLRLLSELRAEGGGAEKGSL